MEKFVITGSTRVKDALEKYPELKEVLISISPKFKKLNNRFVFNIVSKWATFADVARIGGISLCSLLHTLNSKIGTEDELFKIAPECIKERIPIKQQEETPEWVSNARQIVLIDVREREDFFFPEIIKAISSLEPHQILKILIEFYPAPLINMLSEKGHEFHVASKESHFEVYVKYRKTKTDFSLLDQDLLKGIRSRVEELEIGEGFSAELSFDEIRTIRGMSGAGAYIKSLDDDRARVYFFKINSGKPEGRIPLTIQSATPVVFPVIARFLRTTSLHDRIFIKDIRIWEETERHLGWILKGKADISFSAVAAASKLYQKELDIKMRAIVVWNNFFILTHGFKAGSFSDLKGVKIHVPLVKAAPPFVVTKYLLKKLGYSPDEFHFVFGNPFGRPEVIKEKLVAGEAKAAVLREPEASFALFEGDVYESIVYRDLWEKFFPGMGDLPNAGILIKGEIERKHPELVSEFLSDVRDAVEWVKSNPAEAAVMTAEFLGVPVEEARFFIKRVNLKFAPSEDVLNEIMHYVDVLNESGYGIKSKKDVRELFVG